MAVSAGAHALHTQSSRTVLHGRRTSARVVLLDRSSSRISHGLVDISAVREMSRSWSLLGNRISHKVAPRPTAAECERQISGSEIVLSRLTEFELALARRQVQECVNPHVVVAPTTITRDAE